MASTIVVPTRDQLDNFPPAVADQLITVASAAKTDIEALQVGGGGGVEAPHQARYVMTTNVTALATFTVLQDGITGVAGERVLLAGQTTTSQNGIYTIGTVGAGTAPLTRAADFFTAQVVPSGTICNVSEGTLWANSDWKITTTGAITIGTTNHAWFPKSITQSLALVAGTVTVSNVPILSATKSGIVLTRRIANTCTLTVGGYCATTGGANGVTAGVVGTAALIIEACVGAGTISNADVSTLEVTILNW